MATGQELVELANEHRGETYVFGARVNFKNPNYRGPWDCAEFISWVVFQITDQLIGVKGNEAFTGYWEDEIGQNCTEISIDEAKKTPGSIFLRFPGQISGHIAFSDGLGKTIEAMDKNNGVKSGKVDGRIWDAALLINGVDYSQNSGIKPYLNNTISFRYITPSTKSNTILVAKRALSDYGIDAGELNDEYNQDMEIAIYNFQLMKGLLADGIMGPKTMRSLDIG